MSYFKKKKAEERMKRVGTWLLIIISLLVLAGSIYLGNDGPLYYSKPHCIEGKLYRNINGTYTAMNEGC